MSRLQRLNKKFYQQPTFTLARKLLGKFIVRKIKQQTLIAQITEIECYYGHEDKASHASKGRTARTELMFGQPGLAYIYLIYGMYYCFNLVTEAKDFPAAILIRAVQPISGIKQMHKNRGMCHPELSRRVTCHGSAELTMTKGISNGPGKLCQALQIDKKLNGENLLTSHKLYLAADPQIKIGSKQIGQAKRIGIDYAGSYRHKLWRYYLKEF